MELASNLLLRSKLWQKISESSLTVRCLLSGPIRDEFGEGLTMRQTEREIEIVQIRVYIPLPVGVFPSFS